MWKRLDPKISTSEKHAKFGFSPITLWVMMLPHTDAMGRYWANAAYIKGQCLPLFEHVRLEQVDQALRELAEVRLIHLYDSDGKKLLVYHDVTDFNPPGALRYQRPQWGDPPIDLCKCLTRRESGAYTPLVSSSSPSSLNSSPPPSKPDASDVGNDADKAITQGVIDLWNVGKVDKEWIRSTPKRLAKVSARLKDGFTPEQITTAVSNCLKSEWHQGVNDRGWKAPGPEWVLHTVERLEEWINKPASKNTMELETVARRDASGPRKI